MSEELLDQYVIHLRSQDYRDETLAKYVWIMRRNLAKGDLLAEAFRVDLSRSYHEIAVAAALAWSRWVGGECEAIIRSRLHGFRWRRVKEKLPPPGMSDADWNAFRDATATLEDPMRAFVDLMCMAGMRISDTLRIRRQAILEATDAVLVEVKGGREVEYPFAPLRGPLERLARAGNWEVAWQLLSDNVVAARLRLRGAVKRVAKRAGITRRMYPHLLRHTVGYRALDRSGDIHLVSRLLQHDNISTTEGYVRRRAMQKVGTLIEA